MDCDGGLSLDPPALTGEASAGDPSVGKELLTERGAVLSLLDWLAHNR